MDLHTWSYDDYGNGQDEFWPNKNDWIQSHYQTYLAIMHSRHVEEGDLNYQLDAMMSAWIYVYQQQDEREDGKTLMDIAKAKAFVKFCEQTGIAHTVENFVIYAGVFRSGHVCHMNMFIAEASKLHEQFPDHNV